MLIQPTHWIWQRERSDDYHSTIAMLNRRQKHRSSDQSNSRSSSSSVSPTDDTKYVCLELCLLYRSHWSFARSPLNRSDSLMLLAIPPGRSRLPTRDIRMGSGGSVMISPTNSFSWINAVVVVSFFFCYSNIIYSLLVCFPVCRTVRYCTFSCIIYFERRKDTMMQISSTNLFTCAN